MAILHTCLDESGKFRDSQYVSFCGYISYAHDWEEFSRDWQSALLNENLSVLHAKDAYHFNGEEWKAKKARWGDEAESKRDALLLRFARIINEHAGPCTGAAVDCAYYRSMPSEFRQRLTDPHYLAFEHAVREAVGWSNVANKRHTVGIIVDDDQEYSVECYGLLTKLKLRAPDIKQRVVSICFATDDGYPPLQAADLLAYVTRQELIGISQRPERKPSELYAALTINHRQTQPVLFGAQALDEIALSLRNRKA
jgi:hypothetical protein